MYSPANESKEPLIAAADEGDAERVKTLLEAGHDVNARDEYEQTALIVAANRGHAEIAETLLDSGADADAADVYGQTPLFMAALQGHPEILGRLLTHGADDTLHLGRNGESLGKWIENALGIESYRSCRTVPGRDEVKSRQHCRG